MTDDLIEELLQARRARTPCALVTIATTTGSVPREAGSKMLVYTDRRTSGTIGGGKFESLVVEESLAALEARKPVLKSYPLHEASSESFGAVCGGEATVLIEPQNLNEALYLIGGGHCAQAIAKLAAEAGFFVTVIEDRETVLQDLPASVRVEHVAPRDFIAAHPWQSDEALVMVSRNHEIDRDALVAAVEHASSAGYIGMIGSKRKVRHVFDQLKARGFSDEKLERVYAPLGLDIGADSPTEIAISALAEILAVLRGRSSAHLRA
ncbi:MAG: XdhC family protein [Chthoniobacterales bacterium]|nr:XdhC family protein [Chthoniobacterales bacterium]